MVTKVVVLLEIRCHCKILLEIGFVCSASNASYILLLGIVSYAGQSSGTETRIINDLIPIT